MSIEKIFEDILAKHKDISEKIMSGNLHHKEFAKLSKEKSHMDYVVEKITTYTSAIKQIKDLDELIKSDDKEMSDLAKQEKYEIEAKIPEFEKNVKIALLPKDENDDKNVMLEIRAGTGGDEAALFAGVLLRMYQRYCEKNKWRFEIMEISNTEGGGIKECTAMITGDGAFGLLKYESGTHRVQRVPETENSGRVHTSAATVAILPEVDEIDIKIEEKDLRIDIFRSSGPGGQSVNTTDSAVRITHIPTGVVAACQDERSQIANKEKAMKMLRSRIYEAEEEKRISERSSDRKSQIGSGDRSEKIRTYNYPQGRVTDHRINLTLYQIDKITGEGDLNELINSLKTEDEAKKLANITN